ncbi:tetratricopeptide repeat protein [Bhargavaea beijingensis]|uniref:Tetratricopeptide repeat-containing protein n=1 Tax=Bhargavaea beijingensis TaxID=426756 RepID=A0A1G7GKH3_9BACL|nr:tetratricopeptide repeat protein [Bhargavaea beijingensis]MCW1927558.1 tetratricopeptide repeat protein [Bhargavaea beijingensis]SDE88642.1 Tetratricopeptide repeat-containing protein [Bhargavaea beijingensis]
MNNHSQQGNHKKVINFIPNGEFYYKKALGALKRDEVEKAHKFLSRAADLSPEDADILLQYAILEIDMGRFEHARDLLMTAHDSGAEDPDTLFYLAEVHVNLGYLRDAIRYAQRYLKLAPEGLYRDEATDIIEFSEHELYGLPDDAEGDGRLDYILDRGRRLMESGEFREAVSLLESAIEEHPDFWAAYNNLALAYFYIGETEQAEALLNQVLRGDNGNLHALCNFAVFYFYKQDAEALNRMVSILLKIHPMLVDHRYKLGATLALVGRHQEAYGWLRGLQRIGFEGDPGFYFWLAHAAAMIGEDKVAQDAWAVLVSMDPSKEGKEPWLRARIPDTPENDPKFVIGKLNSGEEGLRLLGLFLTGKSMRREDILIHPEWPDVENMSTTEKLFLANGLGHRLPGRDRGELLYNRVFEATDLLYSRYEPLTEEEMPILEMWFLMCSRAIEESYAFRNPRAIAASAEYMYRSSRHAGTTKKEIAEAYGISVKTLTKYVNELFRFLPFPRS